MDPWLRFKDLSLEMNYQNHSTKNIIKQYKLMIYVIIIFILTNLFSILTKYFLSDIETYHADMWIIRKIFILTIASIIFLMIINRIRYNPTRLNSIEIIKLTCGLIFQIFFDDDFIMKFYQSYAPTYEIAWGAGQIEFTTLLICLFLNRWTYRVMYFVCSSLYFSFIKIECDYEYSEQITQIGFCIVFGIVVYYIEKLSRENYLEFHNLLESEKVWKGLLDQLPEDIAIFDNKGNVRYKNETFLGEKTKKEGFLDISDKKDNQEILSKVNNMRLRDSMTDLITRFERSSSYINLRGDSNINIILESMQDIKIKKKDINANASIKKQNMINKLKKKFRTLSQVIKILNPHLNILLDYNLYLIFDGIYDGKSVEIRVVTTLFQNEKCLMMLCFDTTQRDLIIKLEQNDRYKSIILSTVSHELRNPLNSTISMLQLVVDDEELPLKIREDILQPSLRSLGLLSILINDILDYSQIQANALKLVFQPVDIQRIIFDACVLINIQCQRKGLKLRVHIASDIPKIITTDPNRLTQILLNLLSNALKFTITGYIRILMKFVDMDNDLILISVQDTGIGIKAEDIPQLFQEYGKLDQGKNGKINATGCGLGLNISQKLAKRLGNQDGKGIEVISDINKGTTFFFVIKDKKDCSQDIESMIKDKSQDHGLAYNKLYEKFNKCTMNEEDFDICFEEGDKEDAAKYLMENNEIDQVKSRPFVNLFTKLTMIREIE